MNALANARLFVGNDDDGYRVFCKIELREGQRPGLVRTIDHELVPDFYLEASFTHETVDPQRPEEHGLVSLGAGAPEALRSVVKPAPGWTQADIDYLASLAETWHLNTMKAACSHMAPKPGGYDANRDLVCPETGYRYGSAWLVRLIDADTRDDIREYMQRPNSQAHTALQSIDSFLDKHDIDWSVEQVDDNPHMGEDRWPATHWHFTLKRNGETFEGFYSQGSAHTDEPTAADFLSSLAMEATMLDDTDGLDDFVRHFGFEAHEAASIYQTIITQTQGLKYFLGASYDELLRDTERNC